MRNQVERDVDAAGRGRDLGGERVDRTLVEGVERCAVGFSAGRANVLSHRVERGLRAPGEEYTRPLTREYAGDSTPNRAGATVDHGVLAIEQHVHTSRTLASMLTDRRRATESSTS